MFKQRCSCFLQRLFKKGISVTTFVALVSVYHATFLNMVFYKQVLQHLTLDNAQNNLFFMTMPLVIFCVVFTLINLFYFRVAIKIISIILVLIGAQVSYFMLKFGIVIDRSMVNNLLLTNQAEALSYFNLSLVLNFVLLGLIPAILLFFIKIKKPNYWFPYFIKRIANIVMSLVVLCVIATFFYQMYATFMRNNNLLHKYIIPYNYIAASYSKYKHSRDNNLPHISIGDDVKQIKENENEKPILFVVIVGETARAQNFSLNGYAKKTNPLLEKYTDLINFTDASSCGTYTAHSVPCMFSNMARREYSESKASRSDNLLDILVKAGVNVTWYDNNSSCQGACSERVNYIKSTNEFVKNKSKWCLSSGTCYDDILVDEFDKKVNQLLSNYNSNKQDNLILLHMMGSHGPTYYQRYPKQFEVFKPTCDTNEINHCNHEQLVNTYDNTLVYTDYIIDTLISKLTSLEKEYNVGLIYLSDHGESLGENGVYLHSLPYSFAPEVQTKIPFMLWLSPNLKNILKVNESCLKSDAQSQPYSQDNLFHTILSTFELSTNEYQSNLDIYANCKL